MTENKQAPEVTPTPEENQGEKVDNRLPYERPELRKHGKIHDVTEGTILLGRSFDSRFGSFRNIS